MFQLWNEVHGQSTKISFNAEVPRSTRERCSEGTFKYLTNRCSEGTFKYLTSLQPCKTGLSQFDNTCTYSSKDWFD